MYQTKSNSLQDILKSMHYAIKKPKQPNIYECIIDLCNRNIGVKWHVNEAKMNADVNVNALV